MARLAVFVSGTGSLLEAMLKEKLVVHIVLADRPCCGLEIADNAGIPAALVERTDFTKNFDRVPYTHEVMAALELHRIDLVAMAGYMTVLAPPIFDRYRDRILNTHPSLLPAFPGPHSVRDALDHGVKVAGCTIHVATPEIDRGLILAQQAVPVLSGDTAEKLHERIKQIERKLYPMVIRQFLASIST